MIDAIQQLGRYFLIEKIASGGMAHVYRAKLFGVEGFVKEVAIKKILPHWSGNPDFVTMLIDEAKVLLFLTHANIVQVFELNKEESTYFLVMEFVDGVDLRALVKRLKETGQELPLPLICYIIRQICNGLQFAHEKKDRTSQTLKIVHRDISPQNILVSYEGEVKVTDFGIAKIIGKTTETATGTLKGKFAYMSPEQALGEKVDHRTDLFALGILLFELATGERCFKGDTDFETLEAVRNARFSFPDASLQRMPEKIRTIIVRALQKDREKRYQSASELRNDLRQVENEMGQEATATDLKIFLEALFADEIAKKRISDEELSQKTRIYGKKQAYTAHSFRGKTKVLVGDTRVLEGIDAEPTKMSVVRTVVHQAMRTVIDHLPTPVGRAVTNIAENRYLSYLVYAVAVLTVLFPLLVLLIIGKPEPEPAIMHEGLKHSAMLQAFLSAVAEREPQMKGNTILAGEEKIQLQKEPVKEPNEKERFPVRLMVNALPSGSLILIQSGEQKWESAKGQDLSLDLSAPAEFVVTVSKEGYGSQKRTVRLSSAKPLYQEDIVLRKAVFGGVEVSMKPWGRVSVGSVASGEGTLFSKRNIPVGEYTVRVLFPPQKKSVSTRVSVRENILVHCQAQFGERAAISCR